MRYQYTDKFGMQITLNLGDDDDGVPTMKAININNAGWQAADKLSPILLRNVIASLVMNLKAALPEGAPPWAKGAMEEGRFVEVALNTCAALKAKLQEGEAHMEQALEELESSAQEREALLANIQRLDTMARDENAVFKRLREIEDKLTMRASNEFVKREPDQDMLDWLGSVLDFEPEEQSDGEH